MSIEPRISAGAEPSRASIGHRPDRTADQGAAFSTTGNEWIYEARIINADSSTIGSGFAHQRALSARQKNTAFVVTDSSGYRPATNR